MSRAGHPAKTSGVFRGFDDLALTRLNRGERQSEMADDRVHTIARESFCGPPSLRSTSLHQKVGRPTMMWRGLPPKLSHNIVDT
jgi:hypothetical protein